MARPTPPRLHQATSGLRVGRARAASAGPGGRAHQVECQLLGLLQPLGGRGHLEQAQLGEANGVSQVRASSSTFPSQVQELASCCCPRLLHCPPSLGSPSMVPSTGLKPSLTCVLPMICTPRMSASQPGVIPSQPSVSCQIAGFCSPLCKEALPKARPPHLFPEPGRPEVLAPPLPTLQGSPKGRGRRPSGKGATEWPAVPSL